MKTLRIPLTILCLLALSAISAQAARLASAKVLELTGTVTKYSPNGQNAPLKVGEILTEGDSLSSAAKSSAKLVFSNGSEVTVKQNTSINISNLEQESFAGNQSYEQLQADPSKSQTLLELNYGDIDGHVKKLSYGSNFRIKTPLGTAAIRGTYFSVSLRYDSRSGDFTLSVTNIDGTVDIISTFSGDILFGDNKEVVKEFEGESEGDSTNERTNTVPETKTIKIRISRDNPNREAILAVVKTMVPAEIRVIIDDDTPAAEDGEGSEGEEGGEEGGNPTPTIPAPAITPEDPSIIVVSPETGN